MYSLSCQFRNCTDGIIWVPIGTYGPLRGKERRDVGGIGLNQRAVRRTLVFRWGF